MNLAPGVPSGILLPLAWEGGLKGVIQFLKKHAAVASAVAGLVGGFVAAMMVLYYWVGAAIPDMRQGLRDIAAQMKDLRADIAEAEQRQRDELDAARDRFDVSMRVMRSQMIALRQKVEKRNLTPTEIKEILSSVSDVSKSEAPTLSGHVTVAGPEVPTMPAAVYGRITSGELPADIAEVFYLKGGKVLKPKPTVVYHGLDTQLARAFLAKNGSWRADGDRIRFTYDGGSAYFKLKSATTQDDIAKKVALYNSISEAVSLTIGSPESWNVPGRSGPFNAPNLGGPNIPAPQPERE